MAVRLDHREVPARPAGSAATGTHAHNANSHQHHMDGAARAQFSQIFFAESIPVFMGAMTMAYPVNDERALERLAPGDQVIAKVVFSNGSCWLGRDCRGEAQSPGK